MCFSSNLVSLCHFRLIQSIFQSIEFFLNFFLMSLYLFQSIESRADCFFYRISNSAQARLTCRFLCFVLSIKGKTLAMF